MTHPLTDEICEGLMERTSKYPYTDDVIVDMRAAADWQLEECVEELECLLSIFGTTGVIKEEAVPTIIELFKFNMRPQED